MKKILLSFCLCYLSIAAWAQQGYRIEVSIEGYTGKELYLAYYYGNKQYIKDTAYATAAGDFVFSGSEKLEGGIYMVVLSPQNNYFEIMVDENEQRYKVTTDNENLRQNLVFTGNATDNRLFTAYINFLQARSAEKEKLQAQQSATGTTEAKKAELEKQINSLDNEVRAYQQDIIGRHGGTLTASAIKSTLPINYPEFRGNETDQQTKKWRYTLNHYFDNINLSDGRLLRTPFLYNKIEEFTDKLQVQHPDSITKAMDFVLKQMAPETFKFYLISFVNKYAVTKIVGMDAVYVYLVKKYYATGKADWAEESQIKKMLDNANVLEPLLIGKTAPALNLYTRNGRPYRWGALESKFIVVFFWSVNSSTCKKEIPKLRGFQEKYKDKGVTVMGVCLDEPADLEKSWRFMDQEGVEGWLHVYCQDEASLKQSKTTYNIKSTPLTYLLDARNKILSKQIDAEQLPGIVDFYNK